MSAGPTTIFMTEKDGNLIHFSNTDSQNMYLGYLHHCM